MGVDVEVMTDTGAVTDGIAVAERALNPAVLLRSLEGGDFERHARAFEGAQELGKLAWVAMAVSAGSAYEQHGSSDGLVKDFADRFGLHPTRIHRLVRVYRGLLKPMIVEHGDAVTLRLTEQTWYEYSVEYAQRAGKSPAELLALAEDRKAQDQSYSVRDFKSDLNAGDNSDEGSTLSQGTKLLRYCRKVAEIDDVSLDDAIQGADLHKHGGHVADAFSVLERLNAGLLARRRPDDT